MSLRDDWPSWLNRAIWIAWGVLLGIHLLTLDRTPGGLHYDEAYNALDALRIGNDGGWPAFLQGNFGREPLMVYVMAASLRLFGQSAWAVRFPAALAWGAALPALYWLLRELHPADWQGRTIRWVIAAPLFMTSLWFGILAHYAIRASWFVLLELLFLAALWRVWNEGDVRFAVLAGILGGLCFYTYLPNRLLVVLLGALLAIAFVRRKAHLLARWRVFAIVSFAAMLVALPLVVHFVRSPADFFLRASQVSLVEALDQPTLGSWVSALVDNGERVAGMFFSYGDENPRANIPGRPVLTWWILPLLTMGLVASVWPRRGYRRLFLLLWFLVMLLPTWLTEYAPDFQRAVGAFPPLVLLVAEGGHSIWRQVQRARTIAPGRISRCARSRLARGIVAALLIVTVMMESGLSLLAFQERATMPALFYAFDEGLTQVGQYIAQLPEERLVYLSPVDTHPTLTFFVMAGSSPPEVHSFDGRRALVARQGEDATYVIVTHEDVRFDLMASWLFPGEELELQRTIYDSQGQAYAKVFYVPGTAQLRTPEFSAGITWEDSVHLSGYDLVECCTYRPGDTIYMELWWKAGTEPPREAWTVFAHLLAPEGNQVAVDDHEPGGGSYPTTDWLPRDVIVDEHQFRIPEDAQPGAYTLEVGLYHWQDGQRLRLVSSSADYVVLGSVTVDVSPP